MNLYATNVSEEPYSEREVNLLMKKLLTITMMSTALLTVPVIPSDINQNVNIVSAWEGEDSWEMIERCLYHSGSWLTSTGLMLPEAMMPHAVRVDAITRSAPEEDFAEGILAFGNLDEGKGVQARFIMLEGKVISLMDMNTGEEGMRMMRF